MHPTTTPAPMPRLSRRLFWAGTVLMGVAWIAFLFAAAMGEPAPWPSWLNLVGGTGLVAANVLLRSRPRAMTVVMVAVAALSVVSVIGWFVR